MCLHKTIQKTDTNIIEIASKDIICYKLVKHSSFLLQSAQKWFIKDSIDYYSFYQLFPVEFNKLFIERNFAKTVKETVKDYLKCFKNSNYLCLKFGQDMFHSFVNRSDAYALHSGIEVVECVIPKGSKYIKGTADNGAENYGSERIIYKRIL